MIAAVHPLAQGVKTMIRGVSKTEYTDTHKNSSCFFASHVEILNNWVFFSYLMYACLILRFLYLYITPYSDIPEGCVLVGD